MQPDLPRIVPALLTGLRDLVARRWVGIVLFKANWLLLVTGQQRWLLLVVCLILPLQVLAVLPGNAASGQKYRVLQRCVAFACMGVIVDQSLSFAGVLVFPERWLPAWLLVLWVSFTLVLPHVSEFLKRWPLYACSLAGALGGTLSYQAGAALGAVTLVQPLWLSSTMLALIWAVILPLWRAPLLRKDKFLQLSFCACGLTLILGFVPVHAAAADTDLRLVGRGHYRFLAWPIYDVSLRAAQLPFQFPDTAPFELSVEYKRDFSSAQIIEETRKQWRKQEVAVRAEWQQWLDQALPDVAAGDTLALHVDARYASHFFHNGTLTSSISNPDFTIAFAGIWLATNTSAPRLRAQLLGNPP